MAQKRIESWLGIALVVYLLAVGLGAAVLVIINFPSETQNGINFPHPDGDKPVILPFGTVGSADQGLLLLALFAGIAGSFLHAAQSLVSYLGNVEFKASWAAWYVLRPWIGGILGLAIYFVFRAGLIAGASAVNPYGVVALGMLGGWFSKTTSDKLQEVFETLFKTDADKERKDKLQGFEPPVVGGVNPSPVPAGTDEIVVLGSNFQDGATVLIDNHELRTVFVTDKKLKVFIDQLPQRPSSGTEALIRVKNPEGVDRLSEGRKVLFQ
jgi:hypothetical protein